MRDLRLSPDELGPAQRELYDELCAGPRDRPVDEAGRLRGPFNAMLYAPAVGGPLQRLGAALRYESALADDVRESIICLVAGVHDASYERYAHEKIARAAGVSEDVLAVLARGDLPDGAAAELRLAYHLLRGAPPGDPMTELGPATTLEVTSLVGYYTTLAWQLRLFGVEAPSDE